MEIIVVSAAALFASALTLFSGFGLGTLLMPVVTVFSPVEIAIAITAIVHLANNLFKVALLGKNSNRQAFLHFGIPAVALDKKYLPYGGMISGFFGGLSGHQGAFRSMFLLKAGLTKEEFVATGVMLAVMVDLSRLLIYGQDMIAYHYTVEWPLVTAACVSAFIGAFAGSRMLKKITIHSIQVIVSVLLVVVSLGLISGVV